MNFPTSAFIFSVLVFPVAAALADCPRDPFAEGQVSGEIVDAIAAEAAPADPQSEGSSPGMPYFKEIGGKNSKTIIKTELDGAGNLSKLHFKTLYKDGTSKSHPAVNIKTLGPGWAPVNTVDLPSPLGTVTTAEMRKIGPDEYEIRFVKNAALAALGWNAPRKIKIVKENGVHVIKYNDLTIDRLMIVPNSTELLGKEYQVGVDMAGSRVHYAKCSKYPNGATGEL